MIKLKSLMSFSVICIIYIFEVKYYEKNNRRGYACLDQKQKRIPESPGGHGYNLPPDDVRERFSDYSLWSTFRQKCIYFGEVFNTESLWRQGLLQGIWPLRSVVSLKSRDSGRRSPRRLTRLSKKYSIKCW